MSILPLTQNQLYNKAPSIFATEPYHSVSDRYTYIPTSDVLNIIRDYGWHPVDAFESRVRIDDKQGFQKHLIRLRHMDSFLTESEHIPEIIVTSSHDTSASFEIRLGVFRLVCSNGLILADSMMQAHRIKHIGFKELTVANAVEDIVNYLPQMKEKIETYQNILLSPMEQLSFAKAAAAVRFNLDDVAVDYNSMLETHRDADAGNSLWEIFNKIEESSIKGGIRGHNRTTKRNFTSKPIKSIDSTIEIGQKLFGLADKIATIKSNHQPSLALAA